MSRGTPWFSGIVGILGGAVGVGILIGLVTGGWGQMIPIGLAIIVSLWAIQSINK